MKKIKNNLLGNNIRWLRESKNLTQPDLAKNIPNMSKQKIRTYEENISTPSADTLYDIAKYFEVSVESLFEKDYSKIEVIENNIQLNDDQDTINKVLFVINHQWEHNQNGALIENINSFYGTAYEEYKKTGKLTEPEHPPSKKENGGDNSKSNGG